MNQQPFGSPSADDERLKAEFRRVWAEIKAQDKAHAELSSATRAVQKAAHDAMWAKVTD